MKSALGVFLSLVREALTPGSAPAAGSQGKTDDTPSVWLWQVEPSKSSIPCLLDGRRPRRDVYSEHPRQSRSVWSGFLQNGQSKASLNGSLESPAYGDPAWEFDPLAPACISFGRSLFSRSRIRTEVNHGSRTSSALSFHLAGNLSEEAGIFGLSNPGAKNSAAVTNRK